MQRRSILSGSFYLSKLPAATGLLATLFLLLVTLRRWLFTVVALRAAARPITAAGATPGVLLLVPFRDEAAALPALIDALQRLDYPAHCLHVVFVDDASRDHGPSLCARAAQARRNWHLLTLHRSRGKAAALNMALERFAQGQFVAVFDADERPQPGALRALVGACRDSRVAAASGRRALSNSLASATASYVAFESLVHQLLTQRAKDRLRLAPAILGSNCLYRRQALAKAGGFRAGALLEDSDLTVRLALAGWQLRFAPQAISEHAAPQTLAAYWRQHARWAGGFQDVAQRRLADIVLSRSLSRSLRLELALFSLGYADRLALATVAALSWRGRRTWLKRRLLGAALLTPLLQVIAALYLANAPPQLWMRLPLLAIYFFVDGAMATAGITRGLLRRLPSWERRAL